MKYVPVKAFRLGVMRIPALLMSLLFFGFAALQFNDPDPWIWTSVYGLPALLSLLHARGRPILWFALTGCCVYLLMAYYWAPNFEGRFIDNEEAREAAGLLMGAGWMGILALYEWRRRRAPRRS